MAGLKSNLPEGTVIELVRSLFTTILPTVIMSVSFTMVGFLAIFDARSGWLAALVGLGMAAAAGRIAVLLLYRKQAASVFLDLVTAQRLERRFAVSYLSFAIVFGAFSATAFDIVSAEARVVTVGLLFGYGAGVAAGLSLRPWISISSILIATVPTIIVAASMPGTMHLAAGLLLALFLAGGVHSMLARYHLTAAEITMRRSFSSLARCDHLTGLPNRLSLRERFDEFAAAAGGVDIIAVHCLDLDRFKPVNDRFGHPVGDKLLKAVASRLLGALRECDFAARVGGDEFVVVQTQAKHPEEVIALAKRIVAVIAAPFDIDSYQIEIETSIGFILSSEFGTDIDDLVARADRALCLVKAAGGGIQRYEAAMDDLDDPCSVPIAA